MAQGRQRLIVSGVAQGLGIMEPIISPTYTIIAEYQGRLHLYTSMASSLDEDEFMQTGGEELLGSPGSLSLIEWSERIAGILPKETQYITMVVEEDDGSRIIMIEGDWIENIDWRQFCDSALFRSGAYFSLDKEVLQDDCTFD